MIPVSEEIHVKGSGKKIIETSRMIPITQNINFAPCDGFSQITSHIGVLVPEGIWHICNLLIKYEVHIILLAIRPILVCNIQNIWTKTIFTFQVHRLHQFQSIIRLFVLIMKHLAKIYLYYLSLKCSCNFILLKWSNNG